MIRKTIFYYGLRGLVFFILPIILGELIFSKVYLTPAKTIDFYILQLPIYNISLPFFLKFIIFDFYMWDIEKNFFLNRGYYGFPYPECVCMIFAIITVFNNCFVLFNICYSAFYMAEIKQLLHNIKDFFVLLEKGDFSTFYTMDYTFFLPVIPSVVLTIRAIIIYIVRSKQEQVGMELTPDDGVDYDEILWQRNLMLPGEEEYHNERYFMCRFYGALICYILIYRFLILMNIRLSYFELIGICFGFITIFFLCEYKRYTRQMEKDRHFIYEKIANQIHFRDEMNWKDLFSFQFMELRRLQENYKHSRIRNIRWLELYEHMVVNDAKSIYDAISNWEDGIYSAEKAMEKIKPKIKSIGKISADCVPILPNSKKFNPKEVELIAYFQEKVALVGGIFLNEESIESYNGFVDNADLDAIFQTVKTYIVSFSDGEFLCASTIDDAGWLHVEFILPTLEPSQIVTVQRDINRVNGLWEESQVIDYYNFPIELAVARSYMMDIDGDMLMVLKENRLKLILIFPNTNDFSNFQNDDRINGVIDICEFIEEYTRQNKLYTPFHDINHYYIMADYELLKEVLRYFEDYSFYRIKDYHFICIDVEKIKDMICISLTFPNKGVYPIREEIRETFRYWHTLTGLASEHTALPLLMMKNKMDQLSGAIDLSLEEDCFYCRLMFKSYESN